MTDDQIVSGSVGFPRWLLASRELRPSDKLYLAFLYDRERLKEEQRYALTDSQVAGKIGVHPDTLRKSRRKLEEAGWLTTEWSYPTTTGRKSRGKLVESRLTSAALERDRLVRDGYIGVSWAELGARHLHLSTRLLWVALRDISQKGHGGKVLRVGSKQLSEGTGLGQKTCLDAIDELHACGWLTLEKRPSKTSLLYLSDRPEVDEATAGDIPLERWNEDPERGPIGTERTKAQEAFARFKMSQAKPKRVPLMRMRRKRRHSQLARGVGE